MLLTHPAMASGDGEGSRAHGMYGQFTHLSVGIIQVLLCSMPLQWSDVRLESLQCHGQRQWDLNAVGLTKATSPTLNLISACCQLSGHLAPSRSHHASEWLGSVVKADF